MTLGNIGYDFSFEALSQKGGSSMNNTDWKFVLALGVAAVSVILAVKIDASDAKEVSIHMIDACKEYAVAVTSD